MTWFGNFLASRFLIKAKAEADADEDIVDPQETLKASRMTYFWSVIKLDYPVRFGVVLSSGSQAWK